MVLRIYRVYLKVYVKIHIIYIHSAEGRNTIILYWKQYVKPVKKAVTTIWR